MMRAEQFIRLSHDDRSEILKSVGFNSDEPLLIAVEAMIERARSERSSLPSWSILGTRNAEGIAAARDACEAHGGWYRATSKGKLDGVMHLETGMFMAVHNTCERTGLDKGAPRFVSFRRRNATRQLREDLQGDFYDVLDDFAHVHPRAPDEDEKALHLCVYINKDTLSTGEVLFDARAELVIGATCSDEGIAAFKYRLPLDLSGMSGDDSLRATSMISDDRPIEAEVNIARKP